MVLIDLGSFLDGRNLEFRDDVLGKREDGVKKVGRRWYD